MKKNTIPSCFTIFFAILISLAGFVSIPLPAYGSLSVLDMLSILSGLLLGGIQGAAAVGLFLTLRTLGLPLYSGEKGGEVLLGNVSNGFFAGCFFGALVAGSLFQFFLPDRQAAAGKKIACITAATLCGYGAIYFVDAFWFISARAAGGFSMNCFPLVKSWSSSFLSIEGIKILATVVLVFVFRPYFEKYLQE